MLKVDQPAGIAKRVVVWTMLLVEFFLYYVAFILIAAYPLSREDDWTALLVMGIIPLTLAVGTALLRRKALRIHLR